MDKTVKLIEQEQNKFNRSSTPLVQKWNRNIQLVEEALEKQLSFDRKVVLATALENTQRRISEHERLYEVSQPTDIGPFKKFAINNSVALSGNR